MPRPIDDHPEERFVVTGLAYLRFARVHRGQYTVMNAPGLAKSRTPELQKAANTAFQVLKDIAFDAKPNADVVKARQLGTLCCSMMHGLALFAANQQIPTSVTLRNFRLSWNCWPT